MTNADNNKRKVKDEREGKSKNNGPDNAAATMKSSAAVALMPPEWTPRGRRPAGHARGK